jgi:hypothetical protein
MRFLLLLLLSFPALAQTRTIYPAQATTRPNEPVDVVFKGTASANPFELTFGATVVGPDSARLNVPGFYNGNGEYVLRLSFSKPGQYTYLTYASATYLTAKTGTVRVAGEPVGNGAVRVDPQQPQRFRYQDGKPYFALAFEADWLFALDYGNAAGLPKTEQLVRDVKANGFNQIVTNVYAYSVSWAIAPDVPSQYNYNRPTYTPFGGTNDAPDYNTLNVSFFQHFDRVVELLNRQSIVAHVMIYVWNKNVRWPAMNTPADNRYFDYVVRRYQAYPNIIWDVSKEALDYGRCDIPYINERIARIRQLDAYGRLVTVHDYEYCGREPQRVDFISIQNWRSDLYSSTQAAVLKHPDRPVMNIEHGGYEIGPYKSFVGNYSSPEVCLIRNYLCLFAGAYSTYYWKNTAWNIAVYDALDPKHTFTKPRYDYYRHLQGLFSRYDFNTLNPVVQKLTINSRVGPDNLASSGYPLTNGKDLHLYLIPGGSDQINAVLPKPASGKLQATWFNPFTGEYRDDKPVDWNNWRGFTSPWAEQYSVLIVKAL